MKTILVILSIIFYLLSYYPYLCKVRKEFPKDPHKTSGELQEKARKILGFLLRLSGVSLTIKGEENIPKNQAALFVGNHRSYFDVLAAYQVVTCRLGFVAKKEMEKIPLLSEWMLYINCIFLDRKNARDGIRMIREGVEKLKDGTSIWIFPEGTRSKGPDELDPLPFKEGSLRMAERADVPIVPVAITGTSAILEDHFPWIRPGKVTMEFGKPFYLKDLGEEYKKKEGAYTRDLIIEMLKKEKETEKA